MSVDRPVFLVGMPRSGTTIVFERLAAHPDLAWPSNYADMWPGLLSANLLRPLLDNPLLRLRGNKKQYGKVRFGNRFLPQPDEAYTFWERYAASDFRLGYLLGREAPAAERERVHRAVSKLLRYQRKSRLAAKLTGPGRIHYLHSLFPDARFIHLIRDGRAVVHSLLNVGFWQQKGGFDGPFWHGGPPAEELEPWHRADRDPGVLAAIQWAFVVRSTRAEAATLPPSQYREVRFEDFVADPDRTLTGMLQFGGLSERAFADATQPDRATVKNMSEKFRGEFDAARLERISEPMQPLLGEMGYV